MIGTEDIQGIGYISYLIHRMRKAATDGNQHVERETAQVSITPWSNIHMKNLLGTSMVDIMTITACLLLFYSSGWFLQQITI